MAEKEAWTAYFDNAERVIRTRPFRICDAVKSEIIGISTNKEDAVREVRRRMKERARVLRVIAATLDAVADAGGSYDDGQAE